MSRVFRALQPFQRRIVQPQVRAFSEAPGPDWAGKFAQGLGAAAFGQCRKYARRLFARPERTPSQQLSQYAYDKTIHCRQPNPSVVTQMEMVGMKEFMGVQRMVVPKHVLREKVRVGLEAKGLPSKVAEAISFELDGALRCQGIWDDFQVEDGGSAHSYRVIVRMSESDGLCDIALVAAGASFDAAKEVQDYERQEIPEYGEVPELVIEYKDGWFGRYETKKTVMRPEQIGIKVLKIPIFKQKTFTVQTMEEMKNHLEGKAMKEVLRLFPRPPKE